MWILTVDLLQLQFAQALSWGARWRANRRRAWFIIFQGMRLFERSPMSPRMSVSMCKRFGAYSSTSRTGCVRTIRLAQNAFDKARVEARKPLPTGERLAMFLSRGLLATRDRRLSDDERIKVAEVLAPFPLLQAAHAAKESFLAIYEAPDRTTASRQFSRWLEELPQELVRYFRPLISAISNNQEIILNYFTHRYTNAFTEAANHLSSLLQQTGRGYGFEVMRIKLL